MDWRVALMAAAAAVSAGAAPAPVQAPPTGHGVAPMASPPPVVRPPYLGDAAPDTYKILPPSPAAGTPRDEADRSIFRRTRDLRGSPRWVLAQNDVDQTGILRDLSCAVGVELTAKNAPLTTGVIARAAGDVSRATNRPKDIYKRPRPYLVQDGPICIEKSEALAQSPDYPSGHNTWGWSVGLILAELAPDRATDILIRARAFGESRLICGVHNMSAVESGRTNGSIIVAALHGQPEFRADLEAARSEIAAARKAGPAPDAAACAKEAELLKSPY